MELLSSVPFFHRELFEFVDVEVWVVVVAPCDRDKTWKETVTSLWGLPDIQPHFVLNIFYSILIEEFDIFVKNVFALLPSVSSLYAKLH